ncbi:MAG: MFS transporter, partial [Rhodospirillales bacterium]|nr:MFS transporter [Rhodospirillales bacterium]
MLVARAEDEDIPPRAADQHIIAAAPVEHIVGSAALSLLLSDFSPQKLIQVVQGCAVLVAVLNLVSLWKQEARSSKRGKREPDGFSNNWRQLMVMPRMKRFLWTVGLGTAAFSMQDIVLEPY